MPARPTVCLVGKTHDFHVTKALGITLEENVARPLRTVHRGIWSASGP